MDTLDGSEWDVVIAGTGIQQSLLALALSRSDKKVLHIDKNDYYGGAEAAFSLQEAEAWVERLQNSNDLTSSFVNASINVSKANDDGGALKLSFSRAYSLALAPQLIYADSKLLPSLVSSKTYRQLEFVAMGSWFVFDKSQQEEDGALLRIPTTREDLVFSDKSIDIRSKRAVMKVLRFLVEFEAQEDTWKPYSDKPFADFLTAHFKLPDRLHGLFHALTLSLDQPERITTAFALPRIARHLRTMGHLGPGFNSVIPKWGGLSEVAQVACRAGAVGGAVYVLNKGLKTSPTEQPEGTGQELTSIMLTDNEKITTSWIVGTQDNISMVESSKSSGLRSDKSIRRSITIISSALLVLFPALAEGAPPPAGAVVIFPHGTFSAESASVNLIIHSSDTGECPQGQCVAYAATYGPVELLGQAVAHLLDLVKENPAPSALWSLKYDQRVETLAASHNRDAQIHTIVLPAALNDLVFDETVLENVKGAWQKVANQPARGEGFLVFEDRNSVGDEDDE